MTPDIYIPKRYYPKMSPGKMIVPDNGHLYMEYHRLCDTARDLSHIRDTAMREVFQEEIVKRQKEILQIIKIN